MELISAALRIEFREFCVSNLIIRQIADVFEYAGFRRSQLRSDRPISGQRRILVEEYYASTNWSNESDSDRFLKVIEHTLAQTYIAAPTKRELCSAAEREGLIVDGYSIYRKAPAKKPLAVHVRPSELAKLRGEFLEVQKLAAKPRGYAFEAFLNNLFEVHGLAPRKSFRLTGEQIDGSFQLDPFTYLVEARWRADKATQADLLILAGRVGKSEFGRGMFISISDFSEEGLEAFSKGRPTNTIGMSGQDLFFILDGEITLIDAITRKARRAAENGDLYTPLFEIIRG